jgi:CheY-like chemotaxis protein
MTENSKIKILCVEDELDIRENIVEILRDEGFEVFGAENGQHGFEVFNQISPDIVISDIMMPEVDGYGLLKLIRESRSVNRLVPFIFLTALGQKQDILKGVSMTANDYLIKPVDFDVMIAKIKEKLLNRANVQQNHARNVDNLRNQVSTILVSDVFSYLDVITNISELLKQEPFGPLPHRRYLEEIEKIHLNAVKLRGAVINSLDEDTINNRLNTTEEIFSIFDFLQDSVSGLSDKFKSRISLEKPSEDFPRVKIDSSVFLEALRKILAGMFNFDKASGLRISLMSDHLDQIIVIFYLESDKKSGLADVIKESEISKILDRQNCRFEVVKTRENTAILTIPSYRLI